MLLVILLLIAIAILANTLYAVAYRRPDPLEHPRLSLAQITQPHSNGLGAGDLLLFSGCDLDSNVFKTLYWSPWTHVAVVIDPETFIHCDADCNCRKENLSTFISTYCGDVALRRLRPEFREAFVGGWKEHREELDRYIEFDYSPTNFLSCVTSKYCQSMNKSAGCVRPGECPRKLNCSQFAALVYFTCLQLPDRKGEIREGSWRLDCHPHDFSVEPHTLFEDGLSLLKLREDLF